jgi:hypothetical protein
LWAWQQAKDKGVYREVLKNFSDCAKSVKVRFEHLPDEHQFERKKFLLRQEARDNDETETMNGWNLLCAVNDVRQLLIRSGMAFDEHGCESWLLGLCSGDFFQTMRNI